MSITQTPEVRNVLRLLREDPEFDQLIRQRVWSPQHLAVVAATWGLFLLGAVLSSADVVPWFISIPLSATGVYIGFTTLHDATHRSVSTSPRVNDFLGMTSGFLLLPGVRTSLYRVLHVEHHRWVGDKRRDPDYWLVSAPKPLLPLFLMLPEVLWLQWYIRYEWATRSTRDRLDFATVMGVYFTFVFGFLLSPWASTFIVIYLIPQKLAMLVPAYAFAHIHHPKGADWEDSPFESTVRMSGGPLNLNRVLWLGQADHCIHHFFPQIPFDKYRHGWALANGVLESQTIPERGLLRPTTDWESSAAVAEVPLVVTVERREKLTDSVDLFRLSGGVEPLPVYQPGSHIQYGCLAGLCGATPFVDPARIRSTPSR